MLTFAGHLWTNIFNKVAAEFPEVTTDYMHVDAATIYLVTQPERFDVIVTDNLFGDIITDLAAAVSGGIGVAASGNINPSGEFPSMFEPVHGSAPDIAGQGKADPTATVLSVALLLRHLGYEAEAARIEEAVSADLAERAGKPARSTVGDRRRARRTSSRLTRRATRHLSKPPGRIRTRRLSLCPRRVPPSSPGLAFHADFRPRPPLAIIERGAAE